MIADAFVSGGGSQEARNSLSLRPFCTIASLYEAEGGTEGGRATAADADTISSENPTSDPLDGEGETG